jgi:hypothetical protein
MKIRIFLLIVIFLFSTLHFSHISYAKDRLYEEIEEKAEEYKIPAQNACMDKIWKATPGYNGKEVDIKASYENMKRKGSFDMRNSWYIEKYRLKCI